MEFIFFIGGAVVGTIITTIIKNCKTTCGVIEVDHRTEQCKIHITSNELSNLKIKKAVFMINHNANISREEQSL